jgi:hypothetical protein
VKDKSSRLDCPFTSTLATMSRKDFDFDLFERFDLEPTPIVFHPLSDAAVMSPTPTRKSAVDDIMTNSIFNDESFISFDKASLQCSTDEFVKEFLSLAPSEAMSSWFAGKRFFMVDQE